MTADGRSARGPVLVVDDDDDIREGVIEVMESAGYRAIGATNGREALETARATHPRPCLVVLDLMMPVMDGHDFRAAQLQDEELAAIPVVVVSAFPDGLQQSRQLRAAAFVRKPVDTSRLLALAKQHCA